MPLYFKKDSDFTIIFSDSHYREQAIKVLEKFRETTLFDPGNPNSVIHAFKITNRPPHLVLDKEDVIRRCKAFEYGVMIDGTGEKWTAAVREQVVVDDKAEVNEIKNVNNDSKSAKFHHFDLQQYIADCCRTECSYDDATERATNWIDLLHGAIGLTTEIGELQDTIKRYIFYGKELDTVNIEEELGDICYYIAIVCKSLNLDLINILEKNIAKLKKRYPNGFNENCALNRNIEEERKVLENEK